MNLNITLPLHILNFLNEKCQEIGIDLDWMKAIIAHESQGNFFMIHYDSTYNFLYKPESFFKKNGITLATEIQTQKMSWGLTQIKGAQARQIGFDDLMPKLIDPEINIRVTCKYIQNLKEISDRVEDVFAMYGGGGVTALNKEQGKYLNQGYVDLLMFNLKEYENLSKSSFCTTPSPDLN